MQIGLSPTYADLAPTLALVLAVCAPLLRTLLDLCFANTILDRVCDLDLPSVDKAEQLMSSTLKSARAQTVSVQFGIALIFIRTRCSPITQSLGSISRRRRRRRRRRSREFHSSASNQKPNGEQSGQVTAAHDINYCVSRLSWKAASPPSPLFAIRLRHNIPVAALATPAARGAAASVAAAAVE